MNIVKRIVETPLKESFHYLRDFELLYACLRHSRITIETLLETPKWFQFFFKKTRSYLIQAQTLIAEAKACCNILETEKAKGSILENNGFWEAQNNFHQAMLDIAKFVQSDYWQMKISKAKELYEAQTRRRLSAP